MKTLILLRHAKSSWDDPAQADHDRPLNARGRAAAPLVAGWLAAQGHRPDLVLCSSAARTRETVARMPGLPLPVIEARLYHADPAMILRVLAEVQGADCVMIVGHQPGLGELARALSPPPAMLAEFPTAAAAVFSFDIAEWSEARPGTALLAGFIAPRMLV